MARLPEALHGILQTPMQLHPTKQSYENSMEKIETKHLLYIPQSSII
jgi:hypothetical protein